MTEGDAVDLDLLNTLIDRINELEDANNVQVYLNQLGQAPTSSMTTRTCVQAGTALFTPIGANYEPITVAFRTPFATAPVVVISPTWAGGNTYVVNVGSASTTQFIA